MAARNLTEAFIIMRNNALQTKHIYAEQNLSDRMALVGPENVSSDGVELRGINLGNTAPPPWIDSLEETQYILSRLKTKVDSLIELQSKQLTRPTLDDNSQEERQMEQLTREIGRAFSSGFRQVQTIRSAAKHETKHAEKQLAVSAVMALSSALQELGLRYRSAQQDYLQKINSREERNRLFFDDEPFNMMNKTDYWLNESTSSEPTSSMWQGQQRQDHVLLQLDDVEQDIRIAVEREQEVENIVQSISELQNVFKELAVMVQDQGTVLDRIDYNMEQTQVQVQEGCQQLKKAESYKTSNRKMYFILILIGSIFSLIFFYVIFKS
ncbi:syntaxin-16 [Nasonia vitripennis]|uniref:t-SNARE coiled-coil homology domain-containing protein n=1 Tax=Nasonia vitripennis TaxID=7425 RepID=A0A7M7QV02_NASVI|nr:syntaxin-16 [Nasonia vitripennis]